MKFHIGTVLSIVGKCLLAPNKTEDIYKILNYMTNDNLFTHQLPRAIDECRPWILRQHPQLENYNDDGCCNTNWEEFLKEQVAKFGEHLDIEPIPTGEHDYKNPIDEAVEIVGDKSKVIAVKV